MSPAEITTRVRQECLKRVDSWRSWEEMHVGIAAIRSGDQPSFFFGPGDLNKLASIMRDRFPAECAQLIQEADCICEHRFNLLGYRDLHYGAEIDWHLDAINNKRAPVVPWHKVRFLDFNEVGDAKVTWELNRLQFLVTLARAFRVTGDAKYRLKIDSLLQSWVIANPYPLGINWASSLEVAFRALSLIWTENLVLPAEMPADFYKRVRQLLALSARHIENYLSTYFSPNTHLLGEAAALLFIGTLHPEFQDADEWRELGWQIVLQESRRQVQTDGMHFEHSIHYHVYALDFFLHARALAQRNDFVIPKQFDDVLERMMSALAALVHGDSTPRIGDDDGGRLFAPYRNRSEHMRDPLSTGAVLFRRADLKAAVGSLREETVWLLGSEAVGLFEELDTESRTAQSTVLSNSGFYIQTSPQANARAVIRAGRLGAGRAGHGHADALSVTLGVHGRDVLVDPGTLVYISAGDERNTFRGTGVHNTVQVDGRDQAEPVAPFAWDNLPNVTVQHWHTSTQFDFFAGTHDGYSRLSEPIVHRRWIIHVKDSFWFVRDLLVGVGRHRFDIRYHVAPGLRCESQSRDSLLVAHAERPLLAIVNVTDEMWQREVRSASVSPVYGLHEKSALIAFTCESSAPIEFATVLALAPEGGQSQSSRLSRVSDESTCGAVAYEFADKDVHHFCFADEGRAWRVGECAGDSRFCYWRNNDGSVSNFAICQGTWVEFAGRRIFESETLQAWQELHC